MNFLEPLQLIWSGNVYTLVQIYFIVFLNLVRLYSFPLTKVVPRFKWIRIKQSLDFCEFSRWNHSAARDNILRVTFFIAISTFVPFIRHKTLMYSLSLHQLKFEL